MRNHQEIEMHGHEHQLSIQLTVLCPGIIRETEDNFRVLSFL